MNTLWKRYYFFALLGTLAASFYPLWMGVRVIRDMIVDGKVLKENYPKYIIPYTPICFAVLFGLLILPLLLKHLKRFAFPVGAVGSLGVFLLAETLFERRVVVTTETTRATLADWQMYLCRYVSPDEYLREVTEIRRETPVDLLIGDYNPAFKLHFYLISAVLILGILNCLYGFGALFASGDRRRKKALILQSAATLLFLGLCILACFTAFWRDGNIRVSPLSAVLMAAFFILLGMTAGIFAGSFLLDKKRGWAVAVPGVLASLLTGAMYAGEMILLHGHVYRFGEGFFFDPMGPLVLAPADAAVILFAGAATALLFWALTRKRVPLCAEEKPC